MSKKAVAAYNPMVTHGDIVLFIFWNCQSVIPRRGKAAPSDLTCARLAVLAYVENSYAILTRSLRSGGAYRDRTDDLMLAKQPLSQLS